MQTIDTVFQRELKRLIAHRILDLKRGWIFILAPFLLQEGNRFLHQQVHRLW